MKKLFLFFLLFLLPFLATAQKTTSALYQEEVARHRAQEDSVFKFGEDSPLTAEAKASFKGLDYYPVDEAYRVKARFIRTAQEAVFIMPTTGTRNPEYVKYGELHFQLKGQPLKLSVYQNQELIKQPKYMTYLFIPFTDVTTGQETYETGRYLDFSIPMGTDSVWVDFNKAYNPYCAYGDGYSCPIPPKENKLPVRVEAGVKNYEKGESKDAESNNEIYSESLPGYPGGQQAMMQFFSTRLKLPKVIRKGKLLGTEIISFVIGPDGVVRDVESISSVHPEMFVEAKRVALLMPKWKPGVQNGRAVSVKYRMPLYIRYNR